MPGNCSPATVRPMWRATVLTIFPGMFPGPLGESLAGKASAKGLWSLAAVDIRDYATDKHREMCIRDRRYAPSGVVVV